MSNADQGRLDARLVSFPFEVIARNIGIGTLANSQVAPDGSGDPYVFAGVQVHVPDLDEPTSAHVVVGHRGSTHFTIEGKNTVAGDSSVNDVGANAAPDGISPPAPRIRWSTQGTDAPGDVRSGTA